MTVAKTPRALVSFKTQSRSAQSSEALPQTNSSVEDSRVEIAQMQMLSGFCAIERAAVARSGRKGLIASPWLDLQARPQ
jgi:hypothetical protein